MLLFPNFGFLVRINFLGWSSMSLKIYNNFNFCIDYVIYSLIGFIYVLTRLSFYWSLLNGLTSGPFITLSFVNFYVLSVILFQVLYRYPRGPLWSRLPFSSINFSYRLLKDFNSLHFIVQVIVSVKTFLFISIYSGVFMSRISSTSYEEHMCFPFRYFLLGTYYLFSVCRYRM